MFGLNVIKVFHTFQVKVGDKECDIMSGFYLYITTKLANPAYTPEVKCLGFTSNISDLICSHGKFERLE